MSVRRRAVTFVLLSLVALAEGAGAPTQFTLAQADAAAPVFDPDVVRPSPGSALARALEAQRALDHEAALKHAVSGLANASLTEAMLLRWLGANSARELNRPEESVRLLEPLASAGHPLAPWAKLTLAQLLEGSDAARALTLADELIASASDLETGPLRGEAERLRARLYGKLGREDDAIRELTRLLGDARDEVAPIALILPLADLLATRGEVERVRALALYRAVAARLPNSKLGKRCEEQAARMLASLPEPLKSAHREPSLETQLARADALLADLRYTDAESAYDALERAVGKDARLLCRVRFGRAKALIDRRAREAGSALMAQVAESCTHDPDQRAWARYYAGRAYSNLAKNELAIAQYEALEREAPTHRLADDALFRAAKVARDMGDHEGVRQRLLALPERYPEGDMVPRARFALAWLEQSRGNLEAAVDILSPDAPDEQAEDTWGRTGYFRGRFLLELKQKREAARAFAEVFTRYPLTYYGQQAFARLLSLDPAEARTLALRLSHKDKVPLTFERRPELDAPGFARAVALISAGDVTNGLAELRGLGFVSGSDPELVWLSAALFDRAEAPHLSVDLARRHMRELLSRTPRGRDLALYQLVYPRAYSPLIEETAQRENVPSSFVRAVAREESGFFPRAVSRAKARGLIQLIEPTARAIAKGMGLPAHPEALARPEVNLALGTRFISTLAGNLRGQFALVPVAYNAGPSVANRWLSERASEPLDVWVENIPYDETRHYTRRVLQSYGVYHFLETGQLLKLPLELPAL